MAKSIKLDIKNRYTGCVIFEYESDDNTIKKTLLEAIKANADLRNEQLQTLNSIRKEYNHESPNRTT